MNIRELVPGETDVLDAVFDGLSPTSRYHRFHAPVRQLTVRTRQHLAAVDGREHIAVAAFVDGRPVGIARLIRAGDAPVDLAVEVVDALQRKGIGAALVRAVAKLGAAAGFHTVVADVLAENTAALALIRSVFPEVTAELDGPEVRLTAVLAGVAALAA